MNKKIKEVKCNCEEGMCEECGCNHDDDEREEGFFSVDTTVALYGDIENNEAKDVIYHLLTLKPVILESGEPIRMMINSSGGSLSDAFAIYDTVRELKKEDIVIETKSIGKIFSAAVLLMAMGTKGKRSISKYCRVMLHRAMLEICGNADEAKAEMNELAYRENQYLEALSENSNLTVKQIHKLIDGNTNCYLSPEQAVEYGLVDFIE